MTELLGVEAAAGLAVYGAAAVDRAAPSSAREALVAEGVPGLLAAKDPTLWGPEAEELSRTRLGWIDTFRRSRDLLPQLAELKAELADLDRVVLAGGATALAPEVICRTLGARLTVLDTSDPHQVRAAIGGPELLRRTVVVVSSKSGSTVETDGHRRAFWQAFLDAGLPEAEVGRHFVVVTDPGSPLEETARELGATVLLADPEVGGCQSALTAYGLVPAALAGVDVVELLDQAEALAESLGRDTDNPALALGAALGTAAISGRDRVALVPDGTGFDGLTDWAEQLVAETTGKAGMGILPVVVEAPDSPGATGPNMLTVTLGGSLGPGAMPGGGITPDLAVNGPLGAQFLAWEYATAVAARVLGVEPYSYPDVAESKANTARFLDEGLPATEPTTADGSIEVHAPHVMPAGADARVGEALRWLLAAISDGGYLAVMAYLDRSGDAAAAGLRPDLARATGRPVTFGWGPRFLHSTGQYHKGGPRVGAYLQITGAVGADLPVPGRPYTFGRLQAAQAAGDRQALAARGRPLLWLHLTDRAAGVAQLLDAVRGLGS